MAATRSGMDSSGLVCDSTCSQPEDGSQARSFRSLMEPHDNQPTSSVFGATLILISAIVGSGIVGLPAVFHIGGFYTGIGIIAVASSLTAYSMVLLVSTGVACGKLSYEDLAEHAFGRPGTLMVALAMLCFDYGSCLTYLVILGSMAESIVKDVLGLHSDNWWVESHALRRISMIAFSSLVSLPLCFLRDISSLEKASGACIAILGVVTGVIAVKFVSKAAADDLDGFHDRFTGTGPDVFQAFSIICFAFVCQDSAFLVYGALREKTARNWRATAVGGVYSAVMLCMVLAITGFLTFGPATCPDILNNYANSDRAMLIARTLYMCVMTLVYPICFFVVRHIINAVFFRGTVTASMPTRRFLGVTMGLWLSSIVITSIVFDLSLVMSLAGAFGAITLAFIMPPLIHLKVLGLAHTHSCEILRLPSAWLSLFLLLFGVVALAGSIIQTFAPHAAPPAKCAS